MAQIHHDDTLRGGQLAHGLVYERFKFVLVNVHGTGLLVLLMVLCVRRRAFASPTSDLAPLLTRA
jgi:hypothetical protein